MADSSSPLGDSSHLNRRFGRDDDAGGRAVLPELTDRVAVVTGGAGSIGSTICSGLARAGATVLIVDHRSDRGDDLAAELEGQGGGATFLAADLARSTEVADVAQRILAATGGVDILVQVAGLDLRGTVETTPEEVWDTVMNVNVKAMYLLARHLLQSLRARRGNIVNIGSVQSFSSLPNSAAYVTSKHAVLGLTRAMAVDHAPDVRVNCVAPGTIMVPRLAGPDDPRVQAHLETWAAHHPLGRLGTPEEVAEVVLFLAGPRSSFVTGACYTVDGGLTSVIR